MEDDPYARIAQLEAENAALRIDRSDLVQEVSTLRPALAEALEQQTVAREILRVVASSSTDTQPALDAIVESVMRLSKSKGAVLGLCDGADLLVVAMAGGLPSSASVGARVPLSDRRSITRAVVERRTIHLADRSDRTLLNEFPDNSTFRHNTGLYVPLMRQGEAIGLLRVVREFAQPYSPGDIALVEAFADQAVIAIENARLLEALEQRNADLQESNRQVAEALEQQTATAEVLRVIASKPTNLEAVLQAILDVGVRLCDAETGLIQQRRDGLLRAIVSHGERVVTGLSAFRAGGVRGNPITHAAMGGRAMLERRTIHVTDVPYAVEHEFPDSLPSARALAQQTQLNVPLLRGDDAIGLIVMHRYEQRPFTEHQIALLETFADQAVIAIENARLFSELEQRNAQLTDALEQQSATSEILRVIAAAPGDSTTALQAIAETVTRLCRPSIAVIRLVEENDLVTVAATEPDRFATPLGLRRPIAALSPATESIRLRQTVHTADVTDAKTTARYPEMLNHGQRTTLHVPLVRNESVVGLISLGRLEVQPYMPAEIALVETFADQAVIALENARLFEELERRNDDLGEALEQQTATAEVLRTIASSPNDLQGVLDVVAVNAARLCETDDAVIFEVAGDRLLKLAQYGTAASAGPDGLPIDRGTLAGRAVIDRRTIRIDDWSQITPEEFPGTILNAQRLGFRALGVATPLLREGVAVGVIIIRRLDLRAFTDTQVRLLETFADQAVIAIENARLFSELEQRNAELSEALERQTATAEILRAIASSPTDLQSVLQTIVTTASRLCRAERANLTRLVGDMMVDGAGIGFPLDPSTQAEWQRNVQGRAVSRASIVGRAMLDRRTMYVPDILAAGVEYPESVRGSARTGHRSQVSVPMVSAGEVLGALSFHDTRADAFGETQIVLLEAFADQAVIAIENARLFEALQQRTGELTEALEQQTATSDLLRVIASSPTDAGPVLAAVAESAMRLSDSVRAYVAVRDGDQARIAATAGASEHPVGMTALLSQRRLGTVAMREGRTIHVTDLTDPSYRAEFSDAVLTPARAEVMTPLFRGEDVIGALSVSRDRARPYTERQIELIKAFADQAVIAIENARLFDEIQSRVRELQALGDVTQAVASSLDLPTVLTTIVGNAARLSNAEGGVLYE